MGASIPDSLDAFRAQLERVLESRAFRNKGSLRCLLDYLAGKSLAGEQDLKEYIVGVEAFGKPEGYDPQIDASVRVQASKLRQRLAEYYRTEGASDPIVIEFPKGHFELSFRERQVEDVHPPGLVPASRLRTWKLIACTMGLALLLLGWWATVRFAERQALESKNAWTPELEAIWQPYLDSSRPIVVSLGTPLFTKIDGDFFRSPKINEWEGWDVPRYRERLQGLQALLGGDQPLPSHIFTGVGEATGAFQLCKLFMARGQDLSLYRNSLLSWENLRENNLIFLGAPKYNFHLEDIPVEQHFVLGRGGIKNLDPRPGEPSIYGQVWNDDHSALLEDHAIVIRLPGLHVQGQVTVLAGRSTEATLAAVEYVTQPQYARELAQHLRLDSGELPRSYEVLVHAQFKTQVPLQVSYVTHRVVEPVSQTADNLR